MRPPMPTLTPVPRLTPSRVTPTAVDGDPRNLPPSLPPSLPLWRRAQSRLRQWARRAGTAGVGEGRALQGPLVRVPFRP